MDGSDEEAGGLKQTVNSAAKPGHQVILEDMITAVKTGHDPLVSGEEGRKALEIILAIYQSSVTGMPVRLPLTERGY